MKFEAPGHKKEAFTCPLCGVYSNFYWQQQRQDIYTGNGVEYAHTNLFRATCTHCRTATVWLQDGKGNGQMLWPRNVANVPMAHEQMPDDVAADYLEARSIFQYSVRGAAALLRLAIQKLCAHLGEPGKSVNDDIAAMVKKGLPVQIQQALDIVRVTGNNAVHPGELNLSDNPEIATALFGLVNLIVENRVAEPARIKALYESLPSGAKDGIARRDS